jgi:hypothetical protein
VQTQSTRLGGSARPRVPEFVSTLLPAVNPGQVEIAVSFIIAIIVRTEIRNCAGNTMMSKGDKNPKRHSASEKALAPLAFLTGCPTNPSAVPFSTTAPEGLALVCSASTPAEADLIREVLRNAGFPVEYVPAVTTGAFGTTGNVHIYVQAGQEQGAREFLSQLRETREDGQDENAEM